MPKDIRLNATHYFIMKGPNKQKQIASQNLSDIGFEDFMNLCKKLTEKPYFLVIDTTLASDNPLSFIQNLTERI